MATSVKLGTILRQYALKQESAFVNVKEFGEFLKKYAAKHLEEQAELIQYIEIPEATLVKELEDLASKHEVYLTIQGGKNIAVVITYYSVVYANRYKDIGTNITVPFPSASDLPK